MNKVGSFTARGASHPHPGRGWVFVFLCLALTAFAEMANAQVKSNVGHVNLVALMGESLGVAVSPGQVNFTLPANGVATGAPILTVTTSYNLDPNNGRISTYAYLTSSVAALTDGAGHNIPSSHVSGSVDGAAYAPFTGACPFSANACITVFSKKITGNVNGRQGIQNDTLGLQISTVGLALPGGTYTGVLNIEAQAI